MVGHPQRQECRCFNCEGCLGFGLVRAHHLSVWLSAPDWEVAEDSNPVHACLFRRDLLVGFQALEEARG